MKIAVVGPSPVPFTIGGAENFLWGLCEAINKETKHQAELIKLPSRELGFWELIHTYYEFYRLDLSQFDLVISSKYPAWMVPHHNCICYMQHTLRGLYDTYHLTRLPEKTDRKNKDINKVLDYMEGYWNIESLDGFFQMLFELENQKDIPDSYFLFPGPFIRAIIHFLDSVALSQKGMQGICAISETVKNRTEYYPPGKNVKVIHHPTILKQRNTGDMKHIFIASRLDAPKRIDLLIRAMKYVQSNIPLYIAGNGPQKEEWEKLASNDPRIHFLGFVDEDTLEDYYANSLVIPYFPYDEDYGLITIEAMLHKKPVITTTDAGGPTEFVINGETGFVTKFHEKAVAEKINDLIQNPQEAKRMGENAYLKVKDITWKHTVDELLNQKQKNSIHLPKGQKIKKITVASTFPIYPPQGGGQARIFHLYKNLAFDTEVEIISFTNTDQKRYEGYISKNLKEIRIPKTKKHQEAEWELEKRAKIPVSDIGMIHLFSQTPEYEEKLKESINSSELIIISHPYLYYAIKKYLNGKPFIYEAQDVEAVIKDQMLPNSRIKKELMQDIFQIEKECCEKSVFIMTCSKEDQQLLNQKYGISTDKMIEVPNGVDCDEIPFTSVPERIKNKKDMGLLGEKLGIFMGSWHQPNLEACEAIFQIALECPDTKFLLMGSQCEYFRNRKLPKNVGLLGLVSKEVKNKVFGAVDFALNPMASGSGTNLKMFEYMAAGIPVITTEFGTRGIDDKRYFTICEVRDMSKEIMNLSLSQKEEQIKNARSCVIKKFDWKNISMSLKSQIYKQVYIELRGDSHGFA
ncbi:MAG: glycosyltransferase [Eubacterium sp.]|nr:glycosyltransferase [Eubacterium sp.]